MNSHYSKPLPRPTPVSREFWEGARRHELRLQRCSGCGEHVFYPRVVCPTCLADGLEWVTASGRGKVLSYTVVRRAMHPSFRPDVPYVYAVVELEEGPHMPTNIVGCGPEDVSIDMPVEVAFDDVTEEMTLVKFKPQSALPAEEAEAGEPPAEGAKAEEPPEEGAEAGEPPAEGAKAEEPPEEGAETEEPPTEEAETEEPPAEERGEEDGDRKE